MTATTATLPPLATPKDVSDYAGIPMKTLADWRYKKIGPKFLKVGRMIRYRGEDVEAYLTASEVETTTR